MDRFNITERVDTGSTMFIMGMILVISALLALSFYFGKNDHKRLVVNKIIKNPISNSERNKEVHTVIKPALPPIDPVRQYDYRKSFDPLEEPTKRIPRHWIPPAGFRQYIDIPTRGHTDTYSQLGYLKNDDSIDNKLIRLFGREEYPGSHKWEYYTSLNAGNDSIKIPIEVNKNELYDGDTITVDGQEYSVNIYKNEKLRYHPYII